MVTYLQALNPDTHIVLMGLLPWGLVQRAGVYDWPNLYTEGISIVNTNIEAFAVGQRNVHYVDCGSMLYPDGQVSMQLSKNVTWTFASALQTDHPESFLDSYDASYAAGQGGPSLCPALPCPALPCPALPCWHLRQP